MAITHKQLVDKFKFIPTNESNVGIKAYRQIGETIEFYALKNRVVIYNRGEKLKDELLLENMNLYEFNKYLSKTIQSLRRKNRNYAEKI